MSKRTGGETLSSTFGQSQCSNRDQPKERQEKLQMMSAAERITYFIDSARAPKIVQMEGLETTILTGLHGERMMLVPNANRIPGRRA
mgnify:CR=1 FL=1